MAGTRYTSIPKQWWSYLGSPLRLLDNDLVRLEANDPGPQLVDRLETLSAKKVDVPSPDVSGGGYAPSLESGQIIKTGTNPNAAAYRSEVALPGSPYVRATEGWRLITEFDLNLSGGFATQPTDSWNVLYQTHGRLNDQSWPQPPVELNFQNGTYRVSSSSHAPNAAGQLIPAFSESMPRIRISNPVGTWHTWKFDVVLGGAGRGHANVWCDGEQVVRNWFPLSGTYYSHPAAVDGTLSPYSHEWVYTKIGLYGAGSHTQHRVVQHRAVKFTTVDINNVTRYEMASA